MPRYYVAWTDDLDIANAVDIGAELGYDLYSEIDAANEEDAAERFAAENSDDMLNGGTYDVAVSVDLKTWVTVSVAVETVTTYTATLKD